MKKIFTLFKIILVLVLLDIAFIYFTHGKTGSIDIVPLVENVESSKTDQIKVMSINMAHGGGTGRTHLLKPNKVIAKNVKDIGMFLSAQDSHIVALQEVDAPSWVSGNFSHLERVGKRSEMASAIQGSHVNGLGLQYGTAILSKLKVTDAQQVTFPMSIPTFSKGFVTGTFEWPGDVSFKFDVISLHLDFARAEVRSKQFSIITDHIKKSSRPFILLGNFNTDMSELAFQKFLEDTNLSTWNADDNSIITFPGFGGSRIDWILVSSELDIDQHNVLEDEISDHKVLEAIIKRKG